MKVFKFGGASIKDPEGIRTMGEILRSLSGERIITVFSAMGKTTDTLEHLIDAFFQNKPEQAEKLLKEIKNYHGAILQELFPDKDNPVYTEVETIYGEISEHGRNMDNEEYDRGYDQIIGYGEILSSKIVSAYLSGTGITNTWLDARDLIRTDRAYREAKVDWPVTEKLVRDRVLPGFNETSSVAVTQGFIGKAPDGSFTSLGRDGSDFTGAIMAYSANAGDLTIWKDVPGLLNADPKWFDDTRLVKQLHYYDAIELAYYGANVIHPKTIKPLQNRNIPLYVKSFISPAEPGTVINNKNSSLPMPCFIFKVNQVLISLATKDFSFIAEKNLSDIYSLFDRHKIKINVMQNTAISFSASVNDDSKVSGLIETLMKDYHVKYNRQLELITIRHYDDKTIERVCEHKKILLEQKSRYTVQLVVKLDNKGD